LWSTGRGFDYRPCTAGLVLGWVTDNGDWLHTENPRWFTRPQTISDRRWAGKQSRYVTGHLSQLVNSAFHPSGVGKSSADLWLELTRGMFTCFGWQVTLCDLIWQVTPVALRWSFVKCSKLSLLYTFHSESPHIAYAYYYSTGQHVVELQQAQAVRVLPVIIEKKQFAFLTVCWQQ